MSKFIEYILDSFDIFLSWLSEGFIHQTVGSFCKIQTADSQNVLVANDGSLVSILKIDGVKMLIGSNEFNFIQNGLLRSLQTIMANPGYVIQVYFGYDKAKMSSEISNILSPSADTAKSLKLNLKDLFKERENQFLNYCAYEEVYIVLWTNTLVLTKEQHKKAIKDKIELIKQKKIPPFRFTQNIVATIPEMRDIHESFVKSFCNDLGLLGIVYNLLEVHDAIYMMRKVVDMDFTDKNWRPVLPGDKIRVKEYKKLSGDVSDILWPSLSRQLIPRDAQNLDLRTVRIGDNIYSNVFIDLFPKELQKFSDLLFRTIPLGIPWRISFLIESNGLTSLKIKSALSSILSWTSAQNKLINNAVNLLKYIDLNTDNAVVKLRVTVTTWAPENDIRLLRLRASQLARAIEGWGSCDVSEVSGDAFEGAVSSMLAISPDSIATATVAPLSDVLYMLPLFRPSSPWKIGAILFRSFDGKLWPYQPGSEIQTTWIDLIYARPGAGKSVLSNAINLAVCLSEGIYKLPRIAIIDIGQSSSGLISLLKAALPLSEQYKVVYHCLKMEASYSINPFDTKLGYRFPTAQERSFLVNFVVLLATPIGATKPYDAMPDMIGAVIDEMYKKTSDNVMPNIYVFGIEPMIDGLLMEIGFMKEEKTTWWDVVDTLFVAGFVHEAILAQRHAVPILSETTSICRMNVITDLYSDIITPTGENLIDAFSRMISAAIREYAILSTITKFDLGDVCVAALDLGEVAKSGGDAANRQTAIMYMLARYVLAKDYFFSTDDLDNVKQTYKAYHAQRLAETKEDPKRIVFDEFHRTFKSAIVRDQVIVDMREGRKHKVQICLISQSLDDFSSIMVEFATSIFIMGAGHEQSLKKTAEVFGLSDTAQYYLRNFVHGPTEVGATFLAIFATKFGINTQLLISTLGPIELWAFNTTLEDCVIRDSLYRYLPHDEVRRILANIFPTGSANKYIENILSVLRMKNKDSMPVDLLDENVRKSILKFIVDEILKQYSKNTQLKNFIIDFNEYIKRIKYI